jgi:protein TonB
MSRTDTGFPGRTLEASDSSTRTPVPPPTAAAAPASAIASPATAGSAAVQMPPTSAPQPAPPAPVDVVPAKLVKRVTPTVPSGVSKKTGGFVVVKISITETGKVSDVQVVESTPPGVFDDSAQNAVRKWAYEPRRENGVAVPATARARLVFEPL